jgi:CBS domain-containing protein
MVKYKIGSVVIEKNHLPIGIITDKDLRSKIATGMFAVNATADQIMSAPVITVPVNRSVAEIQLLMMQHNIGHLCVTSDGTSESEIIGIISEHDVLPLRLITRGTCKTDKRAQTPLELKVIRENLTKLIECVV